MSNEIWTCPNCGSNQLSYYSGAQTDDYGIMHSWAGFNCLNCDYNENHSTPEQSPVRIQSIQQAIKEAQARERRKGPQPQQQTGKT